VIGARTAKMAGLTCNDAFLFFVLGYSIVLIVSKWDDYSKCRFPLQIYFVTSYAIVFAFRILSLAVPPLAQRFQSLMPLWRVLKAFQALVLYVFFIVWTIIGTFWFFGDWGCLTQNAGSEYMFFVVCLVFSYLWIITYAVLLIINLKKARCNFKTLVEFEFEAEERYLIEDYEDEADEFVFSFPQGDGLSDDEIRSIPQFTLRKTSSMDGDQLFCSICLEDLQTGQDVTQLPNCGHFFHRTHIVEWLVRKGTCPLCRIPVLPPRLEA